MSTAALEHLPIKYLSAFATRGTRSVAIVLKVYLDGSGKPESEDCKFLTLAALIASDSVWERFESGWRDALGDGTPYSHMRELIGGRGPFQGWSDERKSELVKCLWNQIAQFGRAPSGMDSGIGASITIDMSSYRDLASSSGRVKPVGAICVDYCASQAFAHPEFAKGRAELLFDMGEPYLRHIERTWSRNKRNASSWASRISAVAPVDMRDILPVQGADLLAWSSNRHYSQEPSRIWDFGLSGSYLCLPHYHVLYGRDELMGHPGFFDWKGATIKQ